MKRFLSYLFLLFIIHQVQADELTGIEKKYREWLIGSTTTNYNNPHTQKRYLSILEYVKSAEDKFDNFKFTPDNKFDFSEKTGQKEARAIFAEVLFPLSLGYHLPGDPNRKNPYYHNKSIEKKIIFLYNYLKGKGFQEGIDMQYGSTQKYYETGIIAFGGSMGNNVLGYGLSVFLNKELLAKNNMLEAELKTLNWISAVVGPQFDFPRLWEVKGFNTDGVRSMINNRLCYILSLPKDNSNRDDEAKYFSRLLDKALQIADGCADMIKSDYMGYHHKNAYLSAYATNGFHTASLFLYLLEGTSYQVGEKAIDNLANAVLHMRIYCNKYDCPRALAGRFPHNLGTLIKNMQSYAYLAEVKSPYQNTMKAAFARLWNPEYKDFTSQYIQGVNCKIMYHGSIGAIDMATKLAARNITPESDPNGFWFYPYGGLGVYRKDNWLLSFKGNSKYIWDFEAKGAANPYGRFASAGTLRILAGGKTVSAENSGYTTKGWNWTRLPGATTFDMPYDAMSYKKTRSRTPESFLGGVDIDGTNAIVSMKYDAPLSSLALNKSYAIFDDYVVAMGSGIQAPNDKYSVQTTLFQNGMKNIDVQTTIDGKVYDSKQTKELNKANTTLTDAQGHAYYIPQQCNIQVDRGIQKAPLTKATEIEKGNYTSARILHGKQPDNDSYLYFIQINGGKNGAKYLANNQDNLFNIIQHDNTAHIVRYAKTYSTAYALFTENKSTNDELVKQTDTPCLMVIQTNSDNQIQLAIQNPELGKFEGKNAGDYEDYGWHDKSTVQPVKVTLNGNWKIQTNNDNISVVSNSNNSTEIQFDCYDGQPINTTLIKR
ncbi:hypothetical protein EYV94_13225 [Puteibacter caeruleilacunae]|nr:hypothetical protein EYV94_13225 [Puteibacter caeruleilacunae]